MHFALSYAWSAAIAVDQGASYRRWAEWIWQGRVGEGHRQAAKRASNAASGNSSARRRSLRPSLPCPPRLGPTTATTQTRMNYPWYRQQGLPLTSSHMESTIKQVNSRIKGTEKFWRRETGDAVLPVMRARLAQRQPAAGALLAPLAGPTVRSQLLPNCRLINAIQGNAPQHATYFPNTASIESARISTMRSIWVWCVT